MVRGCTCRAAGPAEADQERIRSGEGAEPEDAPVVLPLDQEALLPPFRVSGKGSIGATEPVRFVDEVEGLTGGDDHQGTEVEKDEHGGVFSDGVGRKDPSPRTEMRFPPAEAGPGPIEAVGSAHLPLVEVVTDATENARTPGAADGVVGQLLGTARSRSSSRLLVETPPP